MQFVKKRDCFCPRMRDAGEECVLRTRESLEAGPQDYEEAAPSRFDLFLEGCCGETRGRGHIHLSAGEEQARAVCMPIGGGGTPPASNAHKVYTIPFKEKWNASLLFNNYSKPAPYRLRLNSAHYDKMKELFRRTRAEGVSSRTGRDAAVVDPNATWTREFHDCLLACLMRYEALQVGTARLLACGGLLRILCDIRARKARIEGVPSLTGILLLDRFPGSSLPYPHFLPVFNKKGRRFPSICEWRCFRRAPPALRDKDGVLRFAVQLPLRSLLQRL